MCWSGWRCLLGSSYAHMLQLSGRRALRISASSQILAFCAATAIRQRHPFFKNNESALCSLLNLRCDYLNKLRLNCPIPLCIYIYSYSYMIYINIYDLDSYSKLLLQWHMRAHTLVGLQNDLYQVRAATSSIDPFHRLFSLLGRL